MTGQMPQQEINIHSKEFQKRLEQEAKFEAVRSSGPGGQNVNKTASKVRINFSVTDSGFLSAGQRLTLIESGITDENGTISTYSQEERSQLQNKERALEKLYEKISMALTPKIERVATRVPKKQKKIRLDNKKKHGEIKKYRGTVRREDF